MKTVKMTENFPPGKLEKVLIDNQIISESQLNWARLNQAESGRRLEDILIDAEILDEKALAIAYSIQYGVPFYDEPIRISKEAVSLVPRELFEEYRFLPVSTDGESISVLVGYPLNTDMLQDIATRTELSVTPCLVEQSRLDQALEKLNASPLSVSHSTVHLLESIVAEAFSCQASDIHFECTENSLVVKYRVHGDLVPMQELDGQTADLLNTRLKIVSNLDITENQTPQEGQFSVKAGNHDLNCRTSIVPAYYGENAVIRILNMPDFNFSLDNIGLTAEQATQYLGFLDFAKGLVLVSGPTGSGKTTTIYSSLQYLSSKFPNKKIVTIEEPIEHPLPGITQTQVSYSKSEERYRVSFASGLKALLRHDPDIIMIGEIRDSESALIAVNAAITGHLVLATVHASDVFEVISRLLFLKVPPVLLVESLRLTISQMLYKQLCTGCRHPVSPEDPGEDRFFEAAGCSNCRQLGFTQRTGVFEMLLISDLLRDEIMKGSLPSRIRSIAEKEGYLSIPHILKEKACAGEIGLQEYKRIIGGCRVL